MLASRLHERDVVASAEAVKDGSTWYVDVQLRGDGSTSDIAELLGEEFSFREPPNSVDARIIDEKQPSTGIITT
jgi:hypothetical protein